MSVGIEVPVGPEHTLRTCGVMVWCATADLPGKAKIMEFTQYNGAYGCTACIHPGETVSVGRGCTRAYRHLAPPALMCTHAQSFLHWKQAVGTGMVRTYNNTVISLILISLILCLLNWSTAFSRRKEIVSTPYLALFWCGQRHGHWRHALSSRGHRKEAMHALVLRRRKWLLHHELCWTRRWADHFHQTPR